MGFLDKLFGNKEAPRQQSRLEAALPEEMTGIFEHEAGKKTQQQA